MDPIRFGATHTILWLADASTIPVQQQLAKDYPQEKLTWIGQSALTAHPVIQPDLVVIERGTPKQICLQAAHTGVKNILGLLPAIAWQSAFGLSVKVLNNFGSFSSLRWKMAKGSDPNEIAGHIGELLDLKA